MKDVSTNYPLAVLSGAISTTFGGILFLFLSLNVATAAAFWVLDDEVPDVLTLLLAGLLPICMACLQLWGFAYVLILVWMLHRLIYQESSGLRTVLSIAPMHLFFSLIVFISKDGWYYYYSAGLIFRAIFAFLALMLPLAAYCYLMRGECSSQHAHSGNGNTRAR